MSPQKDIERERERETCANKARDCVVVESLIIITTQKSSSIGEKIKEKEKPRYLANYRLFFLSLTYDHDHGRPLNHPPTQPFPPRHPRFLQYLSETSSSGKSLLVDGVRRLET